MMNELLLERLKKLGWHHTANQLDSLLEDASKDNVSYSEFLHTIVLHETEQQDSDQLEKRMKRAKLPYQKTIHDFDFTFQPSLSEKRVKETLTCRFIANGENRILLGPPGVGKTHLAVSFAIEAITQGYTALFLSADDLVAQCRKANDKGTLQRLVNRWSRPDVLIVDEVGYFPFDELTANVFFQVVSKRYEQGAMILTSNKSYLEWGKVFGDDVLATAILDRLLHHAITFNIKGDSYRLREKKKAGIYPAQTTI
jgi:DNA replication protein DnaC